MSLTIKNDRSVTISKDVLLKTLVSYLRSQNLTSLPDVSEMSVEFLLSSTELSVAVSTTDVIRVKWSDTNHV